LTGRFRPRLTANEPATVSRQARRVSPLAWKAVDRIAIIGCGGSGKSTVARQLAQILDAPLTHLALTSRRHANQFIDRIRRETTGDLAGRP
jgi:ABC-type phosphate/phosphonate transport system ATPase subunit